MLESKPIMMSEIKKLSPYKRVCAGLSQNDIRNDSNNWSVSHAIVSCIEYEAAEMTNQAKLTYVYILYF